MTSPRATSNAATTATVTMTGTHDPYNTIETLSTGNLSALGANGHVKVDV